MRQPMFQGMYFEEIKCYIKPSIADKSEGYKKHIFLYIFISSEWGVSPNGIFVPCPGWALAWAQEGSVVDAPPSPSSSSASFGDWVFPQSVTHVGDWVFPQSVLYFEKIRCYFEKITFYFEKVSPPQLCSHITDLSETDIFHTPISIRVFSCAILRWVSY